MEAKEQKIKKTTWLRIKHGEDLLKAITEYCNNSNIKAGLVFVIGALQGGKYGYYNQQEQKYHENRVDEPVEIVSCLGNVSLKEGKPFVHAHISLADKEGKVSGGHLNEGCVVFAAECAIVELEGDLLERKLDETTGLSLWDFLK